MASLIIRPASIRDVPSIVEIRLGAVTVEDISEFGVPEYNFYSSIEKLQKMWSSNEIIILLI